MTGDTRLPYWLSDILYFGGKDINLWYRGGHETTLMATINRIIYCLDDDADVQKLIDWATALRKDTSAPQPIV